MEKIVGGDFSSPMLLPWINVGSQHFVWAPPNLAKASSNDSISPRMSVLSQSFGVAGIPQSAYLLVGTSWEVASGGISNGRVTFAVRLVDPNGVTTLIQSGDRVSGYGSENICEYLDIASRMTVAGTYTLRLEATCVSAKTQPPSPPFFPIPPLRYDWSYGYYGGISLLIAERYYKTVSEAIGGSEVSRLGIDLPLEAVGLSESYDTRFGRFIRSKMGLHESLRAIVEGNASEGAGLKESYATHVGKRRQVPAEAAGLDESLRARWKVGNVTMERDVLETEDIWTDILPDDSTEWEII